MEEIGTLTEKIAHLSNVPLDNLLTVNSPEVRTLVHRLVAELEVTDGDHVAVAQFSSSI